MKRWLVSSFIALYLGYLSLGIVCHALKFGQGSHPAMYFVIWDMFCGWTSYELRHHVIGEGISGTYYELDPAPWGEIRPYGNIGRRHYDVSGTYCAKFAQNTLRHTQHEPIARIFVVEENWAKKYNLPDWIWNRRFAVPKDITKYYNVKWIFAPDGSMLDNRPAWLTDQYAKTLIDNPRIQAEAKRGQPVYAHSLSQPPNAYGSGLMLGSDGAVLPRIGAPLGE